MGMPFDHRTACHAATCVIGTVVWVILGTAVAIAGDVQYWAVTGVAADDVLNLRDVPHGDSKKLTGIPPDARGLKNLGCLTPEPNFDRWANMTPDERANAKLQWCRVAYRGREGWVAARFLKPDR